MFEVEVWCNSADVDLPIGDIFMHYKNGEDLGGECPEEISGIAEGYLEEGYHACAACGGEYPEEEMIEEDENLWFCKDCYEEIFG